MKISVVIRSKNEEESLEFLLEVLHTKYLNDIDEVIVLDNLSEDHSEEVCKKFGVRFVSIKKFSYGGSANLAASEALHEIVVIFSAHSYPVSHDFFKIIKAKFEKSQGKLAGIRCLHNNNDYRLYLKSIKTKDSPNIGGLIFSGSAFSKSIWQEYPFNANVKTFEDKEWTIRMLQIGYEIEVAPCIFHYYIKRTDQQLFFRFKNNTIGAYQIFGKEITYSEIFKNFIAFFVNGLITFFVAIYYNFRRLLFLLYLKITGYKKYDLY